MFVWLTNLLEADFWVLSCAHWFCYQQFGWMFWKVGTPNSYLATHIVSYPMEEIFGYNNLFSCWAWLSKWAIPLRLEYVFTCCAILWEAKNLVLSSLLVHTDFVINLLDECLLENCDCSSLVTHIAANLIEDFYGQYLLVYAGLIVANWGIL